jgi:hypothetical protein
MSTPKVRIMKTLKRKNFGKTKLLSLEEVKSINAHNKQIKKAEKRHRREAKRQKQHEKNLNNKAENVLQFILQENCNNLFAMKQRRWERELFRQFSLDHPEDCWEHSWQAGASYSLSRAKYYPLVDVHCTHCEREKWPSSSDYFGTIGFDVKEVAEKCAGRQEFLSYRRQPDGSWLLEKSTVNYAPAFDF